MVRQAWTRNELIVAFNLYCQTAFGRLHNRNPEIIAIAEALGRTPSSLTWKLVNFARLDPELKGRGIRGASHGSKADEKIWNEFNSDWNSLAFESQQALVELQGHRCEQIEATEPLPEGRNRLALVKARVNQSFFRFGDF